MLERMYSSVHTEDFHVNLTDVLFSQTRRTVNKNNELVETHPTILSNQWY
jgi:hypothetical protein